jgi:hypothetical protein
MKTCTKCGVEKGLDLFGKKSASKDGKRSQCKVCDAEAARTARVFRTEARRKQVAALAREARKSRLAAADPFYEPRRKGRNWRAENQERFREVCRAAAIRRAAELRDCYVSRLVVGRYGCASNLPPELIELKREQLRLHRLANQLKQAINEKD